MIHYINSSLLCQVYIPCCLFVLVSWISFIIEPTVGRSVSLTTKY